MELYYHERPLLKQAIPLAGMDLLGGECAPPWPWPGGMQGGCYFHDKAEKYERHNEIHVIVMICHTVSEYHV